MILHRFYILLIAYGLLYACQTKQKADFIIKDACIYTMNAANDTAECMAIVQGKIAAIGSSKQILQQFTSDSICSFKGKYIYPAFTDAHAHFFGLAYFLGECNLYGATSVSEIIQRLKAFHQTHPDRAWLTGRGWDQNLFADKNFPSKEALDSVFSEIPVCLKRVDGHAVWVNSKALEIANISAHTQVQGGEIVRNKKQQPSGILIDNATQPVEQHIPSLSRKELIELLIQADKLCQKHGIHYIHEAGLDLWQIQLLDSLLDKGLLKTNFYVMASLNAENYQYFLRNGYLNKDKLKVRAFKIYADGALGSRGALLKKPYSDVPQKKHFGLLLISLDSLRNVLKTLYDKGFQVCTHAIGDSANKLILQLYSQYLKKDNDRRWRVEHAQIVDTADLWYFRTYRIIPSVQPTHAVSDKAWAIQRLGSERLIYAYAYQSLWKQNERLALGTDFPVEDVSPLKTFFATVFRCNYDLKDTTAFQEKECLSRIQTLRGMTIDASYAAFMEKERGSLEVGKYADFIVLDMDLMKVNKEEMSQYILNKK